MSNLPPSSLSTSPYTSIATLSSASLSSSPYTSVATLSSPWSTIVANSNTILTTNGYGTTTIPNTYGNLANGSFSPWCTPSNPLENLDYNVNFNISESNRKHLLESNIKGIRKNKFIFNCEYIGGTRIQPYEFIMSLIESKEKFSVTIHVSDILSICYTNIQFTKIENNINFDTNCDFSVLKVKFKYEKIKYENHKLSTKELRVDKLKKIIETNN